MLKTEVIPEEKISFIKNQLSIPEKFKIIQKNDVTVTNVKYAIESMEGRTLYHFKGKVFKDKFTFLDDKKNELYSMNLKKKQSDTYEYIIENKKTKKILTCELEKEASMVYYSYKITFQNHTTGKKDILYINSTTKQTEIYHGGRKTENGQLICLSVKSDTMSASHNVIPTYLIQMKQGYDQTFVLLLLICAIRITHGNFEKPLMYVPAITALG